MRDHNKFDSFDDEDNDVTGNDTLDNQRKLEALGVQTATEEHHLKRQRKAPRRNGKHQRSANNRQTTANRASINSQPLATAAGSDSVHPPITTASTDINYGGDKT